MQSWLEEFGLEKPMTLDSNLSCLKAHHMCVRGFWCLMERGKNIYENRVKKREFEYINNKLRQNKCSSAFVHVLG